MTPDTAPVEWTDDPCPQGCEATEPKHGDGVTLETEMKALAGEGK